MKETIYSNFKAEADFYTGLAISLRQEGKSCQAADYVQEAEWYDNFLSNMTLAKAAADLPDYV